MSYKKNVFFLLCMLVMVIPLESGVTTEQKKSAIEHLKDINNSVQELREDFKLAEERREKKLEEMGQRNEDRLKKIDKMNEAFMQKQEDRVKRVEKICPYILTALGIVIAGVAGIAAYAGSQGLKN